MGVCPQCEDGGFMRDPPSVKMAMRHPSLLEVLVVLPTDSGHRMLEARQLILQFLNSMGQDVQLSRLLAYHLAKFVRLENGT